MTQEGLKGTPRLAKIINITNTNFKQLWHK